MHNYSKWVRMPHDSFNWGSSDRSSHYAALCGTLAPTPEIYIRDRFALPKCVKYAVKNLEPNQVNCDEERQLTLFAILAKHLHLDLRFLYSLKSTCHVQNEIPNHGMSMLIPTETYPW